MSSRALVGRRAGGTLLAAAAALLLGACGTAAPAAPPGAEPAATDTAFPVTISHAYGEVTIPAAPQRVVALGLTDLAMATALGAPIVAAAPNYIPETPAPPYLEGRVDPALLTLEEVSLGAGVNLEKVAALDPDLILGVSLPEMAPDLYTRLSAIAPVVTFERELYGSSIQDDAVLIGRALGDEPGAQQVVEEADAAVREFAAARPHLATSTYLYGQARGDVLPMVVGKDNLSTVFMNSLGLTVPPSFADAPATAQLAPGTVGLSYEEAGRLDEADVLFMTFAGSGDRAAFEQNPVVSRLPIVTEGRYEPVTLDTAIALQAPNVVAVPWLLDQLAPALDRIAE
ncbi:ABC transporter substrate-binding protein [Pseudonocardia lacus]|uniref:ABC transporter substrate-binding protein n=1 Tax=Pseudonocardia lacus TaxID=2835865 RepID=UPI001BDCC198|nr:ABC transporter substrate-binding protein [Pseudonocardia lacus]